MPWIVEGDGQRIPEHRGRFGESDPMLGHIPRRLVWVPFEFHSVSLPRRSGPGKPQGGNRPITSAHQSGRHSASTTVVTAWDAQRCHRAGPNDTIQPAAAKRLAIRTNPIRRSVAIDC
jgi:hypothetical protein